MKRLLLLVFVCTSAFAYCQPKNYQMTILEKLFDSPDSQNKIIQEKADTRRELVRCKSKNENSFKKYILTEYGYENMVTGSAYIVSKIDIPKDKPLFDIKLGKQPVINFDRMDQSEDKNYQSKMTVKLREEHIDVTDPFSKIIFKIDEEETTEICIDHWWVTQIVGTGEITYAEYLSSDCYILTQECEAGYSNDSSPKKENQDLYSPACYQVENAANAFTGAQNRENAFTTSIPAIVILSGRTRKSFIQNQKLCTPDFHGSI